MSFSSNGHRYKAARAPASAQPAMVQQPISLPDNRLDPLRQHSVDSGYSNPVDPSNDGRTFAARTQHRTELSLDTRRHNRQGSDSYPYSPSDVSSRPENMFLPDDDMPQVHRHNSVQDRSPLQRLEGHLGDMSKEEKRARVEQAENVAQQRSTRASGHTAYAHTQIPSRNRYSNAAKGRALSGSNASETFQPIRSGSNGKPRQASQSSQGYFPSRARQYGYDAALTGSAATAALTAYTGAPRYEYDSPSEVSSGGNAVSQALPQTRSKQATTQDAKATNESNSMRQLQDQNEKKVDRAVSNPLPAHSTQASTSQAQARKTSNSTGPTGSPSNTPSSRRVGDSNLQTRDSADTTFQTGSNHRAQTRQLRFSEDVLPEKDNHRRFQGTASSLEEWRSAETATLSAEHMVSGDDNIDGEHKAWWEQDESSRKASNQKAYGFNAKDTKPTNNSFQPALLLKCGPLLRYLGMRSDHTEAGSLVNRFWRGSVMIVTDDFVSQDSSPPVLRLFHEPMETSKSSDSANNDPWGSSNDPVEGTTKCSPTGQTLYLRPAHVLPQAQDLSFSQGDGGLFTTLAKKVDTSRFEGRFLKPNGEVLGRFKEVPGHRLHQERGVTFWRFNIEVELGSTETRFAYRINQGPAIGFWVPARDRSMNVLFQSCNGFSLGLEPDEFSGPDPLWRDVLRSHQRRPFHVMIGGGNQIYNDAVTKQSTHLSAWLNISNPELKCAAPFTPDMQEELENIYLSRYAIWYSQGLFGVANSQIPMINIWDAHDIIDGYGSFPEHLMKSPVLKGLGNLAFKYYMLFQHQSVPAETHKTEPSWLLGQSPGLYINQVSRNLCMSLGTDCALIALDGRTERTHEEILTEQTYKIIFERLEQELVKGDVKHLMVVTGTPVAYPRLSRKEKLFSSRAMNPFKALGRTNTIGNRVQNEDETEFVPSVDGDWTAKSHERERQFLIEDLQDLAAEKSIRITMLSGGANVAAVGHFYSPKNLGIAKDRDFRYMPNIISSGIVNAPPQEPDGSVPRQWYKIHHFDHATDESMIPLFTHDVDGSDRSNYQMIPQRNWCSIRPYDGASTPSASPNLEPQQAGEVEDEPLQRRSLSFNFGRQGSLRRRSSDGSQRPGFLRRLSQRVNPPSSFRGPMDMESRPQSASDQRTASSSWRPDSSHEDNVGGGATTPHHVEARPSFQRRPSDLDSKAWKKDNTGRQGLIDLQGGLEIALHCEVDRGNARGITVPYRVIVPALFYQDDHLDHHGGDTMTTDAITPRQGLLRRLTGLRGKPSRSVSAPLRISAPIPIASNAVEPQKEDDQLPSSVNGVRNTDPTQDEMYMGPVAAQQPSTEGSSSQRHKRFESASYAVAGEPAVGSEKRVSSFSNESRSVPSPTTVTSASRPGEAAVDEEEFVSTRPASTKQNRNVHSGVGNRRYVVAPFGSEHRHNYVSSRYGSLPTTGLDLPLGPVNNRVASQPVNVRNPALPQHSRSGSGPAVLSASEIRKDAGAGDREARNVSPQSPGVPERKRPVSAGSKDPYADLYPEAVDQEFQDEGSDWSEPGSDEYSDDGHDQKTSGNDQTSKNDARSVGSVSGDDIEGYDESDAGTASTVATDEHFAATSEQEQPSSPVSPVAPPPRSPQRARYYSAQTHQSQGVSPVSPMTPTFQPSNDSQTQPPTSNNSRPLSNHPSVSSRRTSKLAQLTGEPDLADRPHSAGPPMPLGQRGTSSKMAERLGLHDNGAGSTGGNSAPLMHAQNVTPALDAGTDENGFRGSAAAAAPSAWANQPQRAASAGKRKGLGAFVRRLSFGSSGSGQGRAGAVPVARGKSMDDVEGERTRRRLTKVLG